MKTIILTLTAFLLSLAPVSGQESGNDLQKLFDELKAKDSLIFNLGFNNCDTMQLRILISDDLEFYHDQSGLLESKEIFIQTIPNLCKMDYKPIRVLVDGSLQVFPLYANGELYGAIQTGVHEFYGEEKDKPRYLTSTAKFTHVWVIEGGEWKLKRILSYDHVIPKN
jgi:hypothetical protein